MTSRLAVKSESAITDLIIIGAGPAGLSCAYFAKKASLSYVVLEAGEVGESWKKMSRYFSLITPMWTNHLPSDIFHNNPFRNISCNRYGDYLQAYARRHKFHILPNRNVDSVEKADNGYLVICGEQIFKTRSVIFATGYYHRPYLPAAVKQISKNKHDIYFHANRFDENYDFIAGVKGEILIVGKGNTAGQLAALLIKMGKKVGFSTRGPIAFRNDDTIKGKIKQFLYFYWELIVITRNPGLKHNSFPPMDATGVKKHYNLGHINTYAEITWIHENRVRFIDGSSSIFSAIIFATGYDPVYENLQPISTVTQKIPPLSPEHKETGIFNIGVDNQFNFRSRYLRGIRNDASKVVTKCKEYLESR